MSPIAETGAIAYTKYFWYAMIVWLFEYLNLPALQLQILWIQIIFEIFSIWLKNSKIPWKVTTKDYILWEMWLFLVIFSLALMIKNTGLAPNSYLSGILSLLIMAKVYNITHNVYSYRIWKEVNSKDAINMVIWFLWEQLLSFIKNKVWKK